MQEELKNKNTIINILLENIFSNKSFSSDENDTKGCNDDDGELSNKMMQRYAIIMMANYLIMSRQAYHHGK